MSKIVLCLILTLLFSSTQAQETSIEWAKEVGLFTMGLDDKGNRYEAHPANQSIVKHGKNGQYTTYSAGSYAFEAKVIHKFNENDSLIWSKIINENGVGKVTVNDIKCDPNGFVFVNGTCEGLADFDPGSGIAYAAAYGWLDAFVAKYDAAGNFIWVRSIGSVGLDGAGWFDITSDGGIVLMGNFYDTLDLDPTTTDDLYARYPTGRSSYLWQLDKDGNYLLGRTFNFFIAGKIVLSKGDLVTTVTTPVSADFDAGNNTSMFNSGDYLLKMSAEGDFKFAYPIKSYATSFDVDNQGCIYRTGSGIQGEDLDITAGEYSFDSPYYFNYLIKSDPDMNLLWVKQLETELEDLVVDKRGNSTIAGRWRSVDDFDPGPDVVGPPQFIMRGHGIFLLQLDQEGNFVDVTTIENADDRSSFRKLKTDSKGTIYWGGSTYGYAERLFLGLLEPYFSTLERTGVLLKLKNPNYKLDSEEGLDMEVYPNPTSEQITVRFVDFDGASVSIYNNAGQLLYTKSLSEEETLIDVQDYPRGIYHIHVTYNGRCRTRKLVKQ